MAIVRYEHSPIATLFDELETIFSSTFEMSGRELEGRMYPRVDIHETDTGYRIWADLPGMRKEDVTVSIDNGVLTIGGEKKQEVEKGEKDRYYHFERSFGKFSRSFTLPTNVDNHSVEARYINGVLEIRLRKTEETKRKAVEVKVE